MDKVTTVMARSAELTATSRGLQKEHLRIKRDLFKKRNFDVLPSKFKKQYKALKAALQEESDQVPRLPFVMSN